MAENRVTGDDGESRAVRYLERRGWSILGRNWRCRAGEIDIIGRDPDGTIAVIEVKCRHGLGYGDPLEAITYAKLRRLRRLAAEWARAQEHPIARLRLDAVGVLVHPDDTATITHVQRVDA